MIAKILLGVWLATVMSAALLFPVVPTPVSWYQFPVIPALEEKARILFFHVPMSWVTVVAFLTATYYGIRYLKSRDMEYDRKSVSSASLGLLFCLLATVTGSIWARFSWGSFWNWDPRETSIFVLLLVYGAYFALRSAISFDEKRATLSAAYAIIAGLTVPFFIFVMPRMVASLHPDPIVNTQGKVHMNGTMLAVFLSSLAGFTALFVWMLDLKIRTLRLQEYNDTRKAND